MSTLPDDLELITPTLHAPAQMTHLGRGLTLHVTFVLSFRVEVPIAATVIVEVEIPINSIALQAKHTQI